MSSKSALLDRPFLTTKDAVDILQTVYGVSQVSDIKLLNSYGDQNFHLHLNNHDNGESNCLDHNGGDEFVLKIFNSTDSARDGWFEMHVKIMLFLLDHGINCPVPNRNMAGEYSSVRQVYFDRSRHDVHLIEKEGYSGKVFTAKTR